MDQGSKGSVLVVEDDDQVRSFIRVLLTNHGYRVVEAPTGADGLILAKNLGRGVDLLLSDMLLPELSGFDLAQQAMQANPHLRVLFMTGYVEGEIVQKCIDELGAGFIDKPFQPNALLARVHEAIHSEKSQIARQ